MSYQGYIEEMLRPLRMYDSGGKFQQGEIIAFGESLDVVSDLLEDIEKEMCLLTAEDWGMEQISQLFVMRPTSTTEAERKEALLALLRIGGDSFTVDALNTTLAGCGTLAHVAEREEVGMVDISFPNIPGIPSGFSNISSILENILPAHLGVNYVFWYITWAFFESMIADFDALDGLDMSWTELEAAVV